MNSEKGSRDFPPYHLLLDRTPNIGPLISCWELDKFRKCWNKSFRTYIILTLLYHQFPNLLVSQQDMSGPRLGAVSNNRWSGGIYWHKARLLTRQIFFFHLRIYSLSIEPMILFFPLFWEITQKTVSAWRIHYCAVWASDVRNVIYSSIKTLKLILSKLRLYDASHFVGTIAPQFHRAITFSFFFLFFFFAHLLWKIRNWLL